MNSAKYPSSAGLPTIWCVVWSDNGASRRERCDSLLYAQLPKKPLRNGMRAGYRFTIGVHVRLMFTVLRSIILQY